MKFLAVFPPAMNDGGAFGVTGLDPVMELRLGALVVCEEVRYAFPKTLADAAGVHIGAEERLKSLPEEWVPQVCCIRREPCPESAECRPDRILSRDGRERLK